MILVLLSAAGGAGENRSEEQIGIINVSAADATLCITCSVPQSRLELIELPPFQLYDKTKPLSVIWQGDGQSKIVIDRWENKKDRIYSKFLLVDGLTDEPLGHPHYVTDFSVTGRQKIKLPRPKSIKGLSCIVDIDDAVELGVKYVHENVHINELVNFTGNPEAVYEFDDLVIPLNMQRIKQLDARMKRFTDSGIAVFVVFLNQMPNDPDKRTPLVHPNSDIVNSPTHLGAFNITDEIGLKYYLGILEFLADRYTRPDGKYGLISSLIVGNEVQQHWIWHNMGDMPEDDFIREYETSLRLAWLACSKFNPDIRVYVSMDHHWNKRGFNNNSMREIPGNVLLEKITARSRAEGDYPWNVAFHPYPENLFEPRFWFDMSPTQEFTTPRITFKNMEVLPRFMKQPDMLYRGEIRDIAFTEQGFHTPDGPDGEKIQAAAYAYAYYKIKHMPEVSAFILHRHVDNRGEGGLELGLWNNKPLPEDKSKLTPSQLNDSSPWRKKYIWHVFKDADTDNWENAFEFAKPILNIDKWGQTPPDKNPEIKSIFKLPEESVCYDFIKEFDKSTQTNNLECTPRNVYRAAGWLVPAIFQHPPQQGHGTLSYTVDIPEINDGQKVTLLFETILGNDKGDGVNYFIYVDSKKQWSTLHKSVAPTSHSVDLTSYAGKKVIIEFVVDKNENEANDWAYWVGPVLAVE